MNATIPILFEGDFSSQLLDDFEEDETNFDDDFSLTASKDEEEIYVENEKEEREEVEEEEEERKEVEEDPSSDENTFFPT